ncbi:MAG: hypothetical protein H0U53_09955 [Actinobacteria bacterium]|nr:hypothetical protein [Actinomycetota bacterium]
MDLDKLTQGEKILGGSSLALFILSFLPLWAKVEVSADGLGGIGDASQRFNAWDAYGILVKLGLLAALIAAGLVIAKAAGVKLEIPREPVYLGLAGVTLVAMALALAIGPDESGSGDLFGVSVEISRGIALFLGTLLAAAMAFGAWMHKGAETAIPGTTGTAPTAPPPAF